jgi:hypothetical protein
MLSEAKFASGGEEKPFNKDHSKGKECCNSIKWHYYQNNGAMYGGGIYFFAFIGAAVYYVQQVSGFWPIAVAILKAIVWPAFLIYKVFTMLHM